MYVSRNYSGHLVGQENLQLPCLFYGEKVGPDFFGRRPCSTHCPSRAPHRPSPCSVRCPDFWLDVVHDAEFPRPGADCFIRPWAQGVSPGGRGPSKRHNPSGIGHGGSGWVAHAAGEEGSTNFPVRFSVEKTPAANTRCRQYDATGNDLYLYPAKETVKL